MSLSVTVKRFIFEKLTQISPTRGFAFLVGLASFMWGVWVLNPTVDSLFNPMFVPLLTLAPEWFWGSLFLVVGATKIIAVFMRSEFWIRISTFMGCLLWFTFATFFLLANWKVTGVPTYYIVSAMNAWIYLQVKFHPEIISGNKVLPDNWSRKRK
jgi:hypothetical protein